ncbi:TIGR03915 family putative DNA repair protein [Prosthecobacter sp.]|jgi:DNA polymerase|uniref:TIGR03915 family putative DNA repair protein n=1 Tax=Prosthecobacter sp. TaxID=1965333 RepID=UPI003784B4E0
MRTIVIEPEYGAWRAAARRLLAQGVVPDEVLWTDDRQEASLFVCEEPARLPAFGEQDGLRAPSQSGGLAEEVLERGSAPDAKHAQPTPEGGASIIKVPAAFLDLARSVAAHTDARRWGMLYRVLWRLTRGAERHLLGMATDRDVRQLQDWSKAVGRDIHKMHAFVRFRLVGTDATTGREQFVAWFEPEHRIVRLASPFFEKRFAGMDWSILTPYECAHWDGTRLHFTAGVSRSSAPDEDALDDLWRTYYRNIFNPARVKISAMQSEMPKKYWKNLPEASLIAGLIAGSTGRVQGMLETEERAAKPAPNNAYLKSLHAMNQSEAAAENHEADPV